MGINVLSTRFWFSFWACYTIVLSYHLEIGCRYWAAFGRWNGKLKISFKSQHMTHTFSTGNCSVSLYFGIMKTESIALRQPLMAMEQYWKIKPGLTFWDLGIAFYWRTKIILIDTLTLLWHLPVTIPRYQVPLSWTCVTHPLCTVSLRLMAHCLPVLALSLPLLLFDCGFLRSSVMLVPLYTRQSMVLDQGRIL